MDEAKLKADLNRDEGRRLKPYLDSVGVQTIGVGRNLADVGISDAEADFLLANDVERVKADLDRTLPGWRGMPEPVARGLANMAFNLGITRLLRFTKMVEAIKAGDYARAANEAMDSTWARQVGARATRIADLFRSAAARDVNPNPS